MDLTPIVQPVLGVVGIVLSGCSVMAVKWLFNKLHLDLTEQQRNTILDAAETGAGMVTAALAKGSMGLSDVHISDPKVQAAANYVMTAAPVAAAALGITQASMAQMIVGKVGNAIGQDPTIPTIPAAATKPVTSTVIPMPTVSTIVTGT